MGARLKFAFVGTDEPGPAPYRTGRYEPEAVTR